jgi:hypothetical protein
LWRCAVEMSKPKNDTPIFVISYVVNCRKGLLDV